MLKKLFLAALIIIASINLAFAKNHLYKAPVNYHSPAHYKGEIVGRPVLYNIKLEDQIPCKTYTFNPGFYLGASPGLRTNYTATNIVVYKGFEGTLFGGYTFISSNFYWAAEIFAQRDVTLQNYTNTVNTNGHTVGLKTTWGGGLSLLPGYIVSDSVLAYLRLGSITTHFQDMAKTITGMQVGIGLEGSVSDDWDLRAEYAYSFYPSIPIFGNPKSDHFHVGFVYKIDP